jgi:uncharacterized membrane protein YhfC
MYNMIDLTKLTPDEAEAIAHAEGFTGIAAMFAQIADLQHAVYALLDAIEDGDAEKLDKVISDARKLLP